MHTSYSWFYSDDKNVVFVVCSCVWQLLCFDADPGPEVAECFWQRYDSGVGACLKKIASCGTWYLAHSQAGSDTPDVLQQPRKIRPQTLVLYPHNRTLAITCLWKNNSFWYTSGCSATVSYTGAKLQVKFVSAMQVCWKWKITENNSTCYIELMVI
jgi:hypothetical protein